MKDKREESTGEYGKNKKAKTDIGDVAPLLNDEIDAMDDAGRSESQQFMKLAKAFKKQAEDDSKAHIKDFESAVASRQDALTSFLEDQVDMMYDGVPIVKMNFIADSSGSTRQGKRLRTAMVDVMFRKDAGREKTTLAPYLAQPVAETLSISFDKFLAAHDKFILLGSDNGELPSINPSHKDKELLKTVLQAQYEQAKQRLQKLLRGDNEGSHPVKDLPEVAKGDEIWLSPREDRPEDFGAMNEQDGSTWCSITNFAGKGVRRIVRGFPET
ncbi:MAG: hypothetical protein LQ349_007027 [Xanthoria aureola]|nr:MAG: hypothetical protein LQ349_007027 [Xanthoria aureola]